ncbi:hypothetical protein GCM10010206_66220 [Streptomyces cinerochromogenes]|nr:hypothetical protein GCM10010206_66220 [Streptomyces cinerochromogenes]
MGRMSTGLSRSSVAPKGDRQAAQLVAVGEGIDVVIPSCLPEGDRHLLLTSDLVRLKLVATLVL